MTGAQERAARRILAHHSKSFALAGRLLPAWCRRDAAALYAWCRRCDDAVDLPSDKAARVDAVHRLRGELDLVYAGRAQSDPVLGAMQDVVGRHAIPRRYAEDLIAGMAMDVGTNVRFETLDDLLLYCYRAAGTVGLMMAHIMNVRDAMALRRAADLGIAMQLTNICRDVAEDQRRGRVYLPQDLAGDLTGELASDAASGLPGDRSAHAVAALLGRAEQFYRSGDRGMRALPLRCAVAIRAARLIYADIGRVIARRGFDVRAGRAIVTRSRKLWLLARAAVGTWARFAWHRVGGGDFAELPDHAPVRLPFEIPIASSSSSSSSPSPSPSGSSLSSAGTTGLTPRGGTVLPRRSS